MSELSREEQAFLDEAYERLKTTRRTFTEREALKPARLEGYELKLSFDPRFARAEPRQGSIPPHWRLAEQTLANARLLNELQSGTWDGKNLDEKLLALDQEDHLSYTFYPHDPRLFLNKQGAWEATGERQITLPLGLKEELDSFSACLHERWSALNTPLTISQVLALLEELGWRHNEIASVHRCVRAWLLTLPSVRRVGSDYWIPVAHLPPEVKRTRLHSLPIRTSPGEAATDTPEGEPLTESPDGTQHHAHSFEPITFKGTATRSHVAWTTTLQSIHLIEGFIPIPKTARGIYPPVTPGEEHLSVVRGLWHEDDTKLWIWLDRLHHRLYGPDLLDKLAWLSAGSKLRIEWATDEIILREAGYDPEVQQEETRLVDLEELKRLRAGIGEGYRQAIQTLLLAAPQGLTFKEIVLAIRQRQQHAVPRRTIRATLSHGGFIQREQRWFAAPSATSGAKKLKEALLETLVDLQEEEPMQTPLSRQEYIRTRVQALHHRLQEITSLLREHTRDQ